MRRSLLVAGSASALHREAARTVAQSASVSFVDLSGGDEGSQVASPDRLAAVLLGGSPTVALVPLGFLAARAARLEALQGAVVVVFDERRSVHEPSEVAEEAHAHFFVDDASAREVAALALAVWERDGVAVAAGDRTYTVEIGRDFAPARVAELTADASRALLVTDRNVAALHAQPIQSALGSAKGDGTAVVLEPGEEHKNLKSVERILRGALAAGLDRSSILLALGGGVVTDMGGFAAACYMRGIRWAALPTTLLAMVDAAVGGKTGVDLLKAKNAVGAFWQPRRVLCDVAYLGTESVRGYRSALAEVVKTALIGDAELFSLLEGQLDAVSRRAPELIEEMVRRCVRVKANVVSRDEREGGLRACLNLGHTVGHALESAGGYTRWTHGEAVSLGLVLGLRVGEILQLTPAEVSRRTGELLQGLGLPTEVEPAAIREASRLLGHDKKRTGGTLKFVVARNFGEVQAVPLPLAELRRLVESLAQ